MLGDGGIDLYQEVSWRCIMVSGQSLVTLALSCVILAQNSMEGAAAAAVEDSTLQFEVDFHACFRPPSFFCEAWAHHHNFLNAHA